MYLFICTYVYVIVNLFTLIIKKSGDSIFSYLIQINNQRSRDDGRKFYNETINDRRLRTRSVN